MGFLYWILLGLVAGVIAKFLHPGPDPGGWIVTILIGIVGSFVGGFLFNLIGFEGVEGFDFRSLIVATIGAVVCLWAYRMFTSRRRT